MTEHDGNDDGVASQSESGSGSKGTTPDAKEDEESSQVADGNEKERDVSDRDVDRTDVDDTDIDQADVGDTDTDQADVGDTNVGDADADGSDADGSIRSAVSTGSTTGTLDSATGSYGVNPSDLDVPDSTGSESTDAVRSPGTDSGRSSSEDTTVGSNVGEEGIDVNAGGGRDRSATDVDIDDVLDEDTEEGDNQGLFDDLLSGEPIFENKEVLRPSYTPHELPHRNDQINQMATILVSALRGDTPSNILIYGKTGTGKTASAKFVSQELESTSQKYDVPCDVEYINCEVTDTQYRVLAQLANKFIEKNREYIDDRIQQLRELRSAAADRISTNTAEDVDSDSTQSANSDPSGAAADAVGTADAAGTAGSAGSRSSESSDLAVLENTDYGTLEEIDDEISSLETDREEIEEVPMTGWPTDRVYSSFFDAVDYHERVVVIMLDEIDKLVEKSGDDTLYNLSRMNSELENSRISIMGISNDLKFTDFLDPRVKSSLGEEEIVFPPYDANQLRDILQHRSDVSFKSDALTDDVIPLCAAFAAQEHGDARRALDLLRTAGELAERSQAEYVSEDHVRQAQDKIELDRVVEVVRTLPTQSKIVLFSIILLEQNGVHSINTGEVFNIYKRLCEEIDADVLTQRRVTDLISELDMLGIVNAVVVSKGRYGRTKEISLSVPIDETEAVLLSDSRLGDIENAQPFVQARFDN